MNIQKTNIAESLRPHLLLPFCQQFPYLQYNLSEQQIRSWLWNTNSWQKWDEEQGRGELIENENLVSAHNNLEIYRVFMKYCIFVQRFYNIPGR